MELTRCHGCLLVYWGRDFHVTNLNYTESDGKESMKTYTAKTLADAIAEAMLDLGLTSEADLNYRVTEEKKGLFGKKATIEVFELSDAIEYAQSYLVAAIAEFGITATTKASLSDDIIHIQIDTDHNSILIGKNGRTLQALNELTKLAVSSKFKRRFRILLDINEYKDSKYGKIVSMAKRTAREVIKSRVSATLDPMPADERRVVHNALSYLRNVKTESVGEGRHRAITIKYVERTAERRTEKKNENEDE